MSEVRADDHDSCRRAISRHNRVTLFALKVARTVVLREELSATMREMRPKFVFLARNAAITGQQWMCCTIHIRLYPWFFSWSRTGCSVIAVTRSANCATIKYKCVFFPQHDWRSRFRNQKIAIRLKELLDYSIEWTGVLCICILPRNFQFPTNPSWWMYLIPFHSRYTTLILLEVWPPWAQARLTALGLHQGSPNFFIRGLHMLFRDSSRVGLLT